MAEWIVDPRADPRQFPSVQHRHPNGTLPAVRDHTPEVRQDLQGPRREWWTYACACGEVYVWERAATSRPDPAPGSVARRTPPPG